MKINSKIIVNGICYYYFDSHKINISNIENIINSLGCETIKDVCNKYEISRSTLKIFLNKNKENSIELENEYLLRDHRKCNNCKELKLKNNFRYRQRERNNYIYMEYDCYCNDCSKKLNMKRRVIYYKNNRNKILAKLKIFRANNKDKINEYNRNRNKKIKFIPFFRLRKSVSESIRKKLKLINSKKNTSCMNYLPYSMKELKKSNKLLYQ